jgi:hypothetical protein
MIDEQRLLIFEVKIWRRFAYPVQQSAISNQQSAIENRHQNAPASSHH